MHKYGTHTELSFHIRLEGHVRLDQAHDLATRLENSIKKTLDIDATIHMEPIYENKKNESIENT